MNIDIFAESRQEMRMINVNGINLCIWLFEGRSNKHSLKKKYALNHAIVSKQIILMTIAINFMVIVNLDLPR